jgi:hypothetical protein
MRRVLNSVDSTFNGARQELNASKDWMEKKTNQRTIDGVHVRITEPKFRFLLLSAVVFACDDGDPGTRSVSSVRRKTLFAFEGDFCE